jgi:hypothetical protein
MARSSPRSSGIRCDGVARREARRAASDGRTPRYSVHQAVVAALVAALAGWSLHALVERSHDAKAEEAVAMKVEIAEKRPCGHWVSGYSLDARRLEEPCPLCGELSDEIVFLVRRVAD